MNNYFTFCEKYVRGSSFDYKSLISIVYYIVYYLLEVSRESINTNSYRIDENYIIIVFK